jgi:phosphatidylethanolamine-binding protein (PEBP) family uncharacterized protein
MQERVSRGGVFARVRVHPLACLLALATLAVGLFAGCGGGSSSTSTSSASGASAAASSASTKVPSYLGAAAHGHTASVVAVARVSDMEIAKSSYDHWLSVERALGVTDNPSHQALGFLITSDWVLGEATARHLAVSEAEVKQRFAQIMHQHFPKAGSLQQFLAKSGETEADLLARVKVELLQSRIAAQVAAGKSAAQRKALLTSFQQAFTRHWKSYTTCEAGYVMGDCSEYSGGPEHLTAPNSSSSSSSGGSASGSSSSSSSSSRSSTGHSASGSAGSSAGSTSGANSSGEVYSSPGSFAITSPAFELNGAIPAQYTCDGADVSPPLEWSNVPAKAAALVLFAIDDTATGPASGIRWIVGDINPTSKGVAAGATPEGGIVGSDTQGHSGYGGICPAPGKTSAMEFVMYALSKRIPLTPGFQPDVAEQEYGAGKLLLGQAAVTYAEYHRP